MKCHLCGIIGFRKLCRFQKCNNIQGIPFENRKLVSLPAKPEVKKKSFVDQKVPLIMYMGYPKFQSITFKTNGDTGGVP